MAKKENQQARILRTEQIDGVPYKVDQVVEFSADQADSLQKSGAVDPHPDAVAYAIGLGAQPVEHVPA